MTKKRSLLYLPLLATTVAAAVFVVIALSGLAGVKVFAAGSGGLELQEAAGPINVTAVPGSVESVDIGVHNAGTQTETLKVNVQKYDDGVGGSDYLNWAAVTPNQMTLAPGELTIVRLTITIPASAAHGYYYLVRFSGANGVTVMSGGKSPQALLQPVFLDVNAPGAKRQLSISGFAPTADVVEFLPASFDVKITNTGNEAVIPHGEVTLSQGNSLLARIPVNPSGSYVLPGATDVSTVTWDDGFPLSDHGHTDVNWAHIGKFRIGQYAANLEIVYDNGARSVEMTKTTSFVVFPWKLLIGMFIVLGLIVWAVVSDIVSFERVRPQRKKQAKKPIRKTKK